MPIGTHILDFRVMRTGLCGIEANCLTEDSSDEVLRIVMNRSFGRLVLKVIIREKIIVIIVDNNN